MCAVNVSINRLDDLWRADARRADGVGLVRTELLFCDNDEEPKSSEQYDVYRKILEHAPGDMIAFRAFDGGGDKKLQFLGDDGGSFSIPVRGVRRLKNNEGVLRRQLSAIAKAASTCVKRVSVMGPMISTREEASWFASLVTAAGLVPSATVETPAGCINIPDILSCVQSVSIGTNDLAQFLFAADRSDDSARNLQDPWQPAFVRAMHFAIGSALPGRVSVCGNAVDDPAFAAFCIGCGASSVVVSVGCVATVQDYLRSRSSTEMVRMSCSALAGFDPASSRLAAVIDDIDYSEV